MYKIFYFCMSIVLLGMIGCSPCCQTGGDSKKAEPVKKQMVSPPDRKQETIRQESSSISASPQSLDALLKGNLKVEKNVDGSIKTLVFSGTPTAIAKEDWDQLSKVRVIRGTGLLTKEFVDCWQNIPRLTEILWTESKMEDNVLSSLANFKELKKLRLAGLQTTKIKDILQSIGQCSALVELDLSGSVVTDGDLAELKGMKTLVRLNLYSTAITNGGVKELEPLAEQLIWLNLDATKMTDAVGPSLAKFKKLEFLHLGRNEITDKILDSLTGLTELKTIHLTRTKITENGADQLRKKLPKTEVITQVKEPAL